MINLTEAGKLHRHDRYDYSPITAGGATAWPNGKKLAVYVAIGIEDYSFDTGHTENLLSDVPSPDLVNASWRDYGNRVGAFRLLKRLELFGIPPTILLNTAAYESAPDLMIEARRLNAEIVGHGISNSDSLHGLSADEERGYLQAVSEHVHRYEGEFPRGWSSPWLTHTANTLDLLPEVGYRYVLDLRLDDRPTWLNTSGSPLLALPYALELNDSTSIIDRHVSASDFADMIIDEFDELLSAADEQPLVMSIVLHAFISGAPFRLKQVSRALHYLASQSDTVWFTQPRGIYDAVVSQSGIRTGRTEQ